MGIYDPVLIAPKVSDFGHHLQRAIVRFGSSRLSDRETEIVQLVLRGNCNKTISARLNISTETVKVHRKRIYTKLGVATHGGLFSVFFAALTHIPMESDTDPLMWLPTGFRPAI